MTELVQTHELLSAQPIPELMPEQVNAFTPDALHARPLAQFDPVATLETMQTQEGALVDAIDLGGDKALHVRYEVHHGRLLPVGDPAVHQSNNGVGYLDFLEGVSLRAVTDGVPVAVSFAGPTDGTVPTDGPNVRTFLAELTDRHGRDFARLFPTLKAVANDAVAGLMTGAVEARRWQLPARNVIYIINGSGFGGAVLQNGLVIAAEPGHVKVMEQLNEFGQERACSMFGQQFVCIERVAAGKAGVEALYEQTTGNAASGYEISAKYQAGETIPTELYANSALITAHAVAGIGEAYELWNRPGDTAVVFHGGIFHVPDYTRRVMQITGKYLGYTPPSLETHTFSAFACAEGAATAAFAVR